MRPDGRTGMITEKELAAMKDRAEKAMMFASYSGVTERLRLIHEVYELRAVVQAVAAFDPDNNNANDLFRIIANARTALGEEQWL